MPFRHSPPLRATMLVILALGASPLAAAKPAAKRVSAPPAPAVASAAAAAALESVPVAAPVPSSQWSIRTSDMTLHAAIARWAAQAGWQLVWEVPVDYGIDADTTIAGSFEQAIGAVADSMQGAEMPLRVIFYNGNRVLRIVSQGAR